MAPEPGFEPGLEDSKSPVLPLDDPGTSRFKDTLGASPIAPRASDATNRKLLLKRTGKVESDSVDNPVQQSDT